MTWRRAPARFAVAIGSTLAICLATAGCFGPETTPTAQVTGIVVPERATAGSAIEVVVEGRGPGEIELDVVDPFAVTSFVGQISDGRATFELPLALTSTSGVVTFVAHSTNLSGDDGVSATTEIVADDEVTSIDIHAGPRTIVADGADRTMVTAVAADRFGNPMPDGTSVTLSLADASGSVVEVSADVDHGLAARLIASSTRAGAVGVFASVDAVSSRRVEWDEVPGAAASVLPIVAETTTLVADGRRLVEISSTSITDSFGNQLPDGHLVQLRSSGPDGVGLATATTIDGVARFQLLAPSRPGDVTIELLVDGGTSEPIEIAFGPAVSSIPVSIERDSAGDALLRVGPVLDDLGALVADGTPMTVSMPDRNGLFELSSVGGVATVELGTVAAGADVVVEVYGVSRTVTG